MVDIAKIEKLMVLMSKHGFDVVQAESTGEKVSLARNAAHAHIFHSGSSHAHTSTSSVSNQNVAGHKNISLESVEETHTQSIETHDKTPKQEKSVQPAGETITSPFVGTFYRSPGPDAPVFVDVGSRVKKGQPLCIVEAMKLMNEIECEMDGEVVAILVDNAKPVEFGTPLFIIAPMK